MSYLDAVQPHTGFPLCPVNIEAAYATWTNFILWVHFDTFHQSKQTCLWCVHYLQFASNNHLSNVSNVTNVTNVTRRHHVRHTSRQGSQTAFVKLAPCLNTLEPVLPNRDSGSSFGWLVVTAGRTNSTRMQQRALYPHFNNCTISLNLSNKCQAEIRSCLSLNEYLLMCFI